MRIGIDVRLDRTGIGRYTLRLVDELVALGGDEQYVLFARAATYADLARLGPRVERRLADVRWYTVAEQVRLPSILRAAKVDLMHFPHFNVPLAYGGPYVVTIHDLTHVLRRDIGRSAGDPAARAWKALPYRAVLGQAVRRARRVIAVSEATRRQVLERLGADPGRVVVTYEGVDSKLLVEADAEAPARLGVREPYVLYVGSAYPHKNLPRLLEAFALLDAEGQESPQLVLAGDHGSYGRQLAARATSLGLGGRVVFTGAVTDRELAALYRRATCLVLVSLSEGFGLPGLEAMALDVPVLASRIDSLQEVYGDAALFADPADPDDIARCLGRLLGDAGLRQRLRTLGEARSARYSWRSTAEATRRIYLDCLGVRSRSV